MAWRLLSVRPTGSIGRATDARMTVETPTAILVDLDDTIIESTGARDRAWESVSDHFGARVEGLTPESLLSAVGEYRKWYWSDPVRHREGRVEPRMALREQVEGTLRGLGFGAGALTDQIVDMFMETYEKELKPFPGATDTLEELGRRDIPLALVTNGGSDYQRRKIDRFELAQFFGYILVEQEFGAGKPDERVYLHALGQLGATPDGSWMVGDNLEWEVAAPKRLGILGIWVGGGRALPEGSAVQPDRTIRTLPDILKVPPLSTAVSVSGS